MKTVYIDGLGLVDPHFSGVGQYILGLLKGLDIVIEDLKYKNKPYPEVKIIVPRDRLDKFLAFNFKHIGYSKFPLSLRAMSALWHRNKLPPIDLWCGRGIYIFPRFVDMPLLFSKSRALVVYDLSFELYRQFSDEGNALFLSREVSRSIKNTQNVIAISNNAKKEIVRFYNLPIENVLVLTPGTDPALFYNRTHLEIEDAKFNYGITGDYILALSNLEPRKNLESLVDAYCNLPRKYTKDIALLLVGVSGWKTDELFKKIVSKVAEGYNIIRPLNYVTDEDKPAIISGAKMLVYPSHYEGFGMPPLEALACGTPVITADNSSLPEVVGNVAKMVPSNNTDELSEAMISYLDNYEEIKKTILREGPKQAEKFSWEKSAKVLLDSLVIN